MLERLDEYKQEVKENKNDYFNELRISLKRLSEESLMAVDDLNDYTINDVVDRFTQFKSILDRYKQAQLKLDIIRKIEDK